jgi:predicted dehydrogenase
MEKRIIKIGIIGFGRMGITHYSIINSHPNVEIVSVADTSKTLLNVLAKYVDKLKVYTDYKQLMDESKPDGIVVCTPPNLHYQVIKYAYEKGIHVFCEKPFTADLSEAKELASLFSKEKLINQVGYANRERDVFIEMNKILKQGLIGKVLRYNAQMNSSAITKKTNDNSWRDKTLNGGGVVFEMASHLIDLTNFFFNPPKKVIGTIMTKVYSKNVDDLLSSTFLYNNGLTGSIYVNWSDESYRKPTISIEIIGEEGKLVGDFYGYKIYLKKENTVYNLRKGWNTFNLTDIYTPVPFYVRGNEFTLQLYRFVELVNGTQSENICDFEDALNTHIVIEKLFNDYKFNIIK